MAELIDPVVRARLTIVAMNMPDVHALLVAYDAQAALLWEAERLAEEWAAKWADATAQLVATTLRGL